MSAAPNQAAVVAAAVHRSFGDRVVLDGIDLTIGPGEFVVLLGRSGTGKSTLLRALAGLDPDYDGYLRVPQERAVVFQEPRLLPWARVLPNVTLGLGRGSVSNGSTAGGDGASRSPFLSSLRRYVRAHGRQNDGAGVGTAPATAIERGRAALAEVGLTDHERAWPATLSGGEAQRVALARALVREPALLLLDEPFGALDALTRIRMHGLLRDLWNRHQPAVLMVTHDVDEAITLADRVLVLDGGKLTLDLTVDVPDGRRRDDPAVVALRTALLAELGVAESAPSP